MIRDEDLDALADAWDRRDKKKLASIGARVGITLALDQFDRIEIQPPLHHHDVLIAMQGALASVAGLALSEVKLANPGFGRAKEFCLAVVHDGSLAVGARGVARTPQSPAHAWPVLAPWFKELARNRERAELWAAAPERARFPLTAEPRVQSKAPDEAGLLHQIVSDPHDRAPRLVLADLLLERGDPRGELIQLDEQARTSAQPGPLDKQIERLAHAERKRLAGDLAEHVDDFTIAGGFVDQVTMTAGAFRKHGERMFLAQPVRELRLKPFDAAALTTLAKTPHLALVRSLVFATAGIGREKAVPLARLAGASLPILEALELASCLTLGADGEAFFTGLDAPRLRALTVRAGMFGGKALAALLGNRGLGSLETLAMYMLPRRLRAGIQIEPNADQLADRAFASLPALPVLRRIQLDAWFVDDARIAMLVRKAPALVELDVQAIGDATCEALAGCRALVQTRLPATVSKPALARLLALPKLASLFVDEDGATAADITRVAEALLAVPKKHPLRSVYFAGDYFQRLQQRFPGA